jgi:hypothetical protein
MEETHDLMEASTASRNLNPFLNHSTVQPKEMKTLTVDNFFT